MTGNPAAVQRLHGVAVRSALALTREVADGPADLELLVGPPVEVGGEPPEGERLVSFVLGDTPVYSAARRDEVLVLRVHGFCEFELDAALGRAVCRPDASAGLGAVSLVARGAFLAFWLGLRGDCVLHASAVEHRGSAVVFLGGSGMGKSTLAGWACSAGARFISDDLLRLGLADGPRWVGRSPELRLRPSAGDLVVPHRRRWAVGASDDGRITALPPVAPAEDGPIDAVVVPAPSRTATGVSVTRLDPLEAALWISRFPRLEGWRLPAAVEVQLEGATRLADQVPVYLATVPWGPPFYADTVQSLLELVSPQATPAAAALRGG